MTSVSLVRLFFKFVLCFASSYGTEDNCRHLQFSPPVKDKALQGHVIHTSDVSDLEMCQFKCYLKPSCISLNLGPRKENNKRSCELCDAGGHKESDALIFREGYLHLGTNNVCLQAECFLNSTCQSGFTKKGYRCLCPAGFTGEWCNIQIIEEERHIPDFEDDEEGEDDYHGENVGASGSGDDSVHNRRYDI